MQLKSNISFEDTSKAFAAKSDWALKKANLMFTVVNNPILSNLATGAVKLALNLYLPIKGMIKNTVFEHFCGGETISSCEGTIKKLSDYNVKTILDYSVEGEKNEASFDITKEEIIKTIEVGSTSPPIPFSVFKVTGIGDADILAKIQADEMLNPEEEAAYERVEQRVHEICQHAHDLGVKVLIDAEETWIQDTIDKLAYKMMELFNKKEAIVFNTYQMYRADMLDNLRRAFHYSAMNNYFLGAKLVRGAYMEKERDRAEEKGYPNPIQPTKEATDDDYNKALAFCIDNKQRVSTISGSHNEYSNYYLALLMEKHSMNNNDSRVWFAQLYGMSDNISFNLAEAGYNVVKYVPYGPVRAVMPYLFRRAKENTSVAGQSSRELLLIRKELKRRR
ncbi:MAG: proline dehydrogenase family protein [Bacteroidota bacterium]